LSLTEILFSGRKEGGKGSFQNKKTHTIVSTLYVAWTPERKSIAENGEVEK